MSNRVSAAQIAHAKEINIEDYILTHEQDNVKKIGRAYYLKDHDSLEISNGLWNWHSQGIGGKNVIDYLITVRGYCFVDAVRHLVGDEVSPIQKITPRARPPTEQAKLGVASVFKLPLRNKNNDRVIAYLESRGINRDLINDCIKKGLLYESATWHNAVFVGRDEKGKARFAAMRGVASEFKADVDGSNKQYGFCLPPEKNFETVYVFESPIDALSHKVMLPEIDGYRLSLGGTALLALRHFLGCHMKIENINICTDNDDAGNKSANKTMEFISYNITRSLPPSGFKDWNEALQNEGKEKILEDKRKDIRFITSDYETLFTVKDGDNIKFTSGYDGEVSIMKCRFIDEAHVTLIGKYPNSFHICELAEKLEKNGSRCEPIPDQKPMLNILFAKYAEPLQDVEIPMTKSSVVSLVGGTFTTEEVKGNHVMLHGKNGVAICKMEDDSLTSVHPYWAQTFKREYTIIAKPPEKGDLLGKIDKFKEKSAEQQPKKNKPDKSKEAI